MKTRSSLLPVGLVIVLILSLALAPGLLAAPKLEGEGQYIRVVVQPGDSLAKYAFTYGTSGSAMLAVNTLPNPDIIHPGEVITIPVIKTQTPSLTTPFYYIAQNGDTLTSVGTKFHMDGFLIGFANNTTVDLLVPGREYVIPAGPHYEIVQRGEHLGTIAGRYGTTIDKLLTANPQVGDASLLSAGQRINVPIRFDAQPVAIPPPGIVVTATSVPPTATGTQLVIIATNTTTAVPSATATNPPPATSTPKPTATSIAAANNYITVVVQPNESLVTYLRGMAPAGRAF
jgi:LysM repeat protein